MGIEDAVVVAAVIVAPGVLVAVGVVGVVVAVGLAVAIVRVGAVLVGDRLDARGRHHPDAAEVRRVDQPVQPAFELQPVDDEKPGVADGPRIGGVGW